MVALNDKAPSNKSTALVLTNDNEVPFYGFYGFNYHNKNLKKKLNRMFLFNVRHVFNDWLSLNSENMSI